MTNYLIRVLFFLVLCQIHGLGRIPPQVKDFLCGCDYCETINPTEPLDIGKHLVTCHGWRDSTRKTMEVMKQLNQPDPHGVHVSETLPKPPEKQPEITETPIIITDYEWYEDDLYDEVFMDSKSTSSISNQWIYVDDLGWVWVLGEDKHFVYSADSGWLYNIKYNTHKIVYWYRQEEWFFSHELTEND